MMREFQVQKDRPLTIGNLFGNPQVNVHRLLFQLFEIGAHGLCVGMISAVDIRENA